MLTGSNGQGKTNLVEAIGYLTTLGSHRVANDGPLVRSGADSAVIRARVVAGERELLAEVQVNRSGPNRAQLNRSAVRPREVSRAVPSMLFAPEDLAIVRGEPSNRRRFADELLVAAVPRLAGVLADYERALKQRNGLLRQARAARRGPDEGSLAVWDEQLVGTGTELLDARRDLLDALGPLVAEQYAVVAGAEQRVTIAPVQSIDEGLDRAAPAGEAGTAERFRAALAAARPREVDRGITLVGPHRDDVLLTINDLAARGYASHGESWSLALALRLGAVELLRETSLSGDPVVILDDVFAELDARRRQRLAEAIARYEQVIITSAVEEDVPPVLAPRVTRIHGGEVLV